MRSCLACQSATPLRVSNSPKISKFSILLLYRKLHLSVSIVASISRPLTGKSIAFGHQLLCFCHAMSALLTAKRMLFITSSRCYWVESCFFLLNQRLVCIPFAYWFFLDGKFLRTVFWAFSFKNIVHILCDKTWLRFKDAFSPLYCNTNNCSAHPIRLMCGLLILKVNRTINR